MVAVCRLKHDEENLAGLIRKLSKLWRLPAACNDIILTFCRCETVQSYDEFNFFHLWQNSPNDLQMLSDAPAHHLFVLIPPCNPKTNQLPQILCVVQVMNILYFCFIDYMCHTNQYPAT
jgi:GNAT acetyltransferase 2